MIARPRNAPGAREIAQTWVWPRQHDSAEWIERNIILPPKVTPTPGYFSFRGRPGFRWLAGKLGDRKRQQIDFVAGSQQGKSIFAVAIGADQAAHSKGLVAHLRPTQQLCDSFYAEKLSHIYKSSPELRKLFAQGRSPLQKEGVRFENGGDQVLASVGSAGGLIDRTARVILLDELDKCENELPGVDVVAMALTRTRVWRGSRKVYVTSTPSEEDRGIWAQWLVAQQWVWRIECPHCRYPQQLTFDQVQFRERDEDDFPAPEEVVNRGLAWYQCEHCRGRIEESQRMALIERGHAHCLTPDRPDRHTALHYSALYSPDSSLHELAAKFIKALSSPAKLTEFNNQDLALPKPKRERPVELLDLALHKGDYQQGDSPEKAVVPEGVQALFLAADAQRDHYWITLLGMGWEGRAWILWAGKQASLTDLRRLGVHTWTTRDKRTLRPQSPCLLDSSDGFRTAELYQFCRETHPWRPTKGQRDQEKPYLWRDVDYVEPGTRRTFAGLTRANLHETYYQDLVQTYLDTAPGDGPGALVIPVDVTKDWLEHMRAMIRRERAATKGPNYYWSPIRQGVRQDLRDALYMALAAADMCDWLAVDKPAPVSVLPSGGDFRAVRSGNGLGR